MMGSTLKVAEAAFVRLFQIGWLANFSFLQFGSLNESSGIGTLPLCQVLYR